MERTLKKTNGFKDKYGRLTNIKKKNNVKTGKFSHCKEKVGELKIDQ